MTQRNRKAKNVFDLIESRMTPESIRRSDGKARKMLLALRLAEFRKAMNKDQSSVKGFSQPAVSKIEGRGDIRLSTLVEYCHGLGAELRITAHPTSKRTKKEFILLEAS
jgi:DNA-binding Xre family transcriptional regulator